MRVGLAISTTEERSEFLRNAISGWQRAYFPVDHIWINTDAEKRGVGWNKNRGLKAMMEVGCTDMFLADDDMYPLSKQSWMRYVESPEKHLMLCWGRSRLLHSGSALSNWSWPRGVLLYVTRDVVKKVGGMRTDFRNGHEHAEWSRRIHQAGFTPKPFIDLAQDPGQWFHCEDMRRPSESLARLGTRRRSIGTMHRTDSDRAWNNELYAQLDGNTDFVEYR